MSYKTVSLNSFTPVSTPTIVDNTLIDGFVDGRPVVIRKMHGGMMMPAIGTIVTMPYGTGIVSGYREDMLVVDVVEFNESFEFETKDIENPDILDASEYVDSLNRCYRRSVESFRSDFRRLYKSEITGNLSQSRQDALDAYFPVITDTTVSMSFSPNVIAPDTPIVYKEVSTPKLSPSERAKQKRLEIAEAKRLADALLAEESIPSDVQAEMDEFYGEF